MVTAESSKFQMAAKTFNQRSAPVFGVYTLRLPRNADSSFPPETQSSYFLLDLHQWCEKTGAHDRGSAQRMSVLPPAADGTPRLSLTCTAACVKKVKQHFGVEIEARQSPEPGFIPALPPPGPIKR